MTDIHVRKFHVDHSSRLLKSNLSIIRYDVVIVFIYSNRLQIYIRVTQHSVVLIYEFLFKDNYSRCQGLDTNVYRLMT